MNPIKTLCAWCNVILKDGPAAPVSHGICPACIAKHFPEANEEIFDRTENLLEFWNAGGTWSMDRYVKHLLAWEKSQSEVAI